MVRTFEIHIRGLTHIEKLALIAGKDATNARSVSDFALNILRSAIKPYIEEIEGMVLDVLMEEGEENNDNG